MDTYTVQRMDKAQLIAKLYYVTYGATPKIERAFNGYKVVVVNGQRGTLATLSDNIH